MTTSSTSAPAPSQTVLSWRIYYVHGTVAIALSHAGHRNMSKWCAAAWGPARIVMFCTFSLSPEAG